MGKLLKAELYRLTHSLWLIIIAVALAVSSTLAAYGTLGTGGDKVEFMMLLADRRYMGLLSIVVGAYFFCMDFAERGFNLAIYSGYMRGQVFFVKHVCYILVCVFVSLLSILTMFVLCRDTVPTQGAWYLTRCIAIRLFIDIGFASVFTLIAYIFKKPVPMVCAGGAYSLYLLFNTVSFYRYWYPAMYVTPEYTRLVIPLLMLLLSPLIAYLVFRRAELK